MTIQKKWRRCIDCQGLFYAADASHPGGVCPAGSEHDWTGSWEYALTLDVQFGPVGTQKGWRWCHKCDGLYYPEPLKLGVCPAGGIHDHTGSGDYWLTLGSVVPKNSEGHWRWCNKCMGLYFAGGQTQGVCPAKGPHDSKGSKEYILAHA